jgi:hypothetical protein
VARAQVGLDEEEGKELDTKVRVKASFVKVFAIALTKKGVPLKWPELK